MLFTYNLRSCDHIDLINYKTPTIAYDYWPIFYAPLTTIFYNLKQIRRLLNYIQLFFSSPIY